MEDENKENMDLSPSAFFEIGRDSVEDLVIEGSTDSKDEQVAPDVHPATKMKAFPMPVTETVADASETDQHSATVSISGTTNLKPILSPKISCPKKMPDSVLRPGPSEHNSLGQSPTAETSSSTGDYRAHKNKNMIRNIKQILKEFHRGQRGNNTQVFQHNPPR